MELTLTASPTTYALNISTQNTESPSWGPTLYFWRREAHTATTVTITNVGVVDVTGKSDQNPSEHVDTLVNSGVAWRLVENGYIVDASGVVTSSPSLALPEPKGLYVGPAHTNLVPYSSDISRWNADGASTLTSSSLVVDAYGRPRLTGLIAAQSGIHKRFLWGLVTTTGEYVYEGVFRAGSSSLINIGLLVLSANWAATGYVSAVFDVVAGVFVSASMSLGITLIDKWVVPLAGGLFLCGIRMLIADGTDVTISQLRITLTISTNPNSISFAGDGVSVMTYAGNMCFTQGGQRPQLIESDGTITSSSSDDVSVPWTGGVNDFAVRFDWTPNAANQGVVYLFGHPSVAGSAQIMHDGTNIIARKRVGNEIIAAGLIFSYSRDVSYKIHARFSSTAGIDIWVDREKGATNANTASLGVAPTDVYIGSIGSGHQSGYFKHLKIARGDLTDEEVLSL